ncbi:GntR family transcriptional regulator [Okibacterium endophyticum]
MTTPGTANIRRLAAPLRQQVVDEIRRAIVEGAYPPGSRLIERVLCEQMQVSRTVIREALRQLEAERLIEMVPNIGSVVRTPTTAEVRSLYEVRAALESLAASDCALRADDATIARLRAALDAVPPAGAPVRERLLAQDAFTEILVEGSENVVVGDMLSSIHSRVSRIRALTLGAGGRERLKPGLTRIYEAVAARDPGEAERVTLEYVAEAAEVALGVVAQ